VQLLIIGVECGWKNVVKSENPEEHGKRTKEEER
jgi:hypothetical protein